METRRMGSLEVSVVGLGCNNFGGASMRMPARCVHRRGMPYQLLRHGGIYGAGASEEFLGLGLDRGAARCSSPQVRHEDG